MTTCTKCNHDPDAVIGASWTFFIERDPPSLNSRLSNHRGGWAYREDRDAWDTEFMAIARGWSAPFTAPLPARTEVLFGGTGKRRVTLTRHYHGRQQRRDRDNLAGGMKACVDAMVKSGLLVDDSEEFAEVHYAQIRSRPTGLHVLIEELSA